MSQRVGDIDLGLHVNTNAFKRQMNGIQGLAKKAGAALAGAFAVKKLVQFSAECLRLGSDLTEVQNVVDTVFPHMTDKVNKFAKEAMNTSGLSETMAKQFTGTYGAMASAFGFTEKEAYKMSTTLTRLSGDVASFYNISQDEAYTKLKSVFTGETETLKELGIVMTQSALDSYAMANGYGKVTSAMSEAEKVSLRYAFVQSQLTHAAGDFAKTADSWANQVRILSLQFESLKANIGQGLINVLSPCLKWINMLIAKLVKAADAFRQFTERITGKKQEPVSIKADAESMESVATAADTSTGAIGRTKQAVKKLKRELAGFDQITKLTDNSQDTGGADTSAPAGPSGGGASTDVGGVTGDEKKVTKLTGAYTKLSESFGRLKTSFKGFTDLCASAGKWIYDNVLVPLGKWTLNKLAPKVLDALAVAFDVLTSAGKALQPLWQWLWDNFFKKIANFAGKVIIKFLELLTAGLEKLSGWIDKHPKLFDAITVSLISFFGAFKLAKGITKFLEITENARSRIKMFSKGIISFKTLFSGLFPKVFSSFGKIKGSTKTMLTGLKAVGGFFLKNPILLGLMAIVAAGILVYKNWDKISKTAIKMKKKVVKVFDDIVGKVKNVPKKIKEFFKGKLDGIADWFSGIKDGFFEAISTLGEGLPDLSEIGEKISESIGEVKATVKAWFADKKEAVSAKWNELTAEIKEKKAELKAEIKQKWENLKASWNAIVDNVKEKRAELKAEIKQKWDSLKASWNAITDNIKTKTASMKAAVKQKWSDISKDWHKITDNIKTKTASMKAKVASKWSSLKSTWNNLMGHFKDKTISIGLKFSAAAADLKKWINTNVIDRVNNKFKSVPILKNHLIPHLAQGGYVKANTPQLAMIGDNRHQGEVVAPERKLEEMAKAAAQNSGGTDPEVIALLRELVALIKALNLEANISGNDLMNLMVRLINQKTKSTGKCPINI